MNIADLFSREDRDQLEKWCRSHTQQAYLGDHRALCRVLGKYLMYVDTRDQSLTPHLLMNGFWEMWVTLAIARHVKPGMVCVDAGANYGYYSLLLSDLVGPTGVVMAYEPQDLLRELLQQSIRVNGFSRTTDLGLALGSHTGSVPLFANGNDLGSGSLISKVGLTKKTQYVNVVQLDGNVLLAEGPVDFVKIDVQGFELEVLRGMRETLARSPNIAIAMEFTPSEHPNPLEALTEIRDGMGLTVQTVGTDGLIRPIGLTQAMNPDTGDHRMLWLTRSP